MEKGDFFFFFTFFYFIITSLALQNYFQLLFPSMFTEQSRRKLTFSPAYTYYAEKRMNPEIKVIIIQTHTKKEEETRERRANIKRMKSKYAHTYRQCKWDTGLSHASQLQLAQIFKRKVWKRVRAGERGGLAREPFYSGSQLKVTKKYTKCCRAEISREWCNGFPDLYENMHYK